jgi:histidinol phosphatase-like PHP family hydrolase
MLDLHFHSTRSDGFQTPAEIVAHGNTWDILTCTDHDFINTEFVKLAREKWIQTCQSVEISAYDPETLDRIQLHITYYAKEVNALLLRKLEDIRAYKIIRIHAQVERLESNGIHINLDDFVKHFEAIWFDRENLNNAHLAAYVYLNPKNVERIHELTGEEMNQMDFIYECLKFNGRFPWIGIWLEDLRPKCNIDIKELLEHAKTDGAVASMAHPNFSLKTINRYRELVPKYLNMWLTSIEINSAATEEWVDEILTSQKEFWHMLTFWSDCHFKTETDNKHNVLGVQNQFLTNSFIETEIKETLEWILS